MNTALASAPGATYEELRQNQLDALEANITGTTHGDDSTDGPPYPWMPSEQDGDRAADVWQESLERQGWCFP